MNHRCKLAAVSEKIALQPICEANSGIGVRLRPVLAPFLHETGGKRFDWCAAFVHYCCTRAGFNLPARAPGSVRCSFGGVWGWVDWAKLPGNRFYFSGRNAYFLPQRGDLVVFDNLLNQGVCDHMGIVLSVSKVTLRTAEGNIERVSKVMHRPRNRKVRGYIRIPNNLARWSE